MAESALKLTSLGCEQLAGAFEVHQPRPSRYSAYHVDQSSTGSTSPWRSSARYPRYARSAARSASRSCTTSSWFGPVPAGAEVNEQLGPERLAQLDGSMEQNVRSLRPNEGGVVDALRPDADDDLLVVVLAEQGSLLEDRGVERKSLIAEQDADVAVRALDRPFEQVHRGRSDEAADERVRGPRVDLL